MFEKIFNYIIFSTTLLFYLFILLLYFTQHRTILMLSLNKQSKSNIHNIIAIK